MIRWMYKHYVDQYQWFIRADDDVHIKTREMARLLMRINPNGVYSIGQPGTGRKDIGENLYLKPQENFCMGGPSVMYSRSALKKFGSEIQ